MPLVLRGLIIVGLVALAAAALFLFDFLSFVREALIRSWHWIAHSLLPLFKVYGVRRITSPFLRVATKAMVLLLGVRFATLMRTRFRQFGVVGKRMMARWKTLPALLRWAIGGVAIFALGFLGLGIFIIPLWIPGLGRWFRSFHFWWIDKVGGRWITPVLHRFRRLMRTNPFWRAVRRPHRVLMYHLFTHSRAGVRTVKSRFARRAPAAALPEPGTVGPPVMPVISTPEIRVAPEQTAASGTPASA